MTAMAALLILTVRPESWIPAEPTVCNPFADRLVGGLSMSAPAVSALVRLWALQGSNLRPPPCKGGALRN